jgi:SAM-dependent methyltransferase
MLPIQSKVATSSTDGGYHWLPQLCPICEIPPAKSMGMRGGASHRQALGVQTEIWRCGKCGLIFPNPMPVPINGLEQHYAISPDIFFHNHESSSRERGATYILGPVERLLGGKGRLLDIGAGRGELLKIAGQQGWSVVGIEPSSTFAEYASSFSGAEIRQEPIERCGFADGTFDVVILSAVLEHLYQPDDMIREISRLLRPGGVLYVDVPNEDGLYFRVGNLYQRLRGRKWVINLSPTFSPFHVFGFTPSSLRALLSKHGLKPEVWRLYEGVCLLPDSGGFAGMAEKVAARVVTRLSKLGSLGNYVETWAVKL